MTASNQSGNFKRCRHADSAALLFLASSLAAPQAGAWMINEDYQQRDARPATDFHIFLAGDVTGRITGGGKSDVTNPFAAPKVAVSKTAIGNTQVTFSGTGTIAQNLTANRHFGLFGSGAKPAVRLKAWSYGTSPFLQPVPVSNFNASYNPATQSLRVTVENLSDDVVTLAEAGYRLFSSEQPIDLLNRIDMPPSSFIPLSILNGEYGVGQTESFVIPNVLPTASIVTYGTLSFTGTSANNDYNADGLGTAGEWMQVSTAAQMVAEPASTSLLLAGIAAMLLLGRRRRLLLPALVSALAFLAQPAGAWERGNHAGDWAKGGTLKIAVDTPPGDAAQQAAYLEAVAEAMAEWNDAQIPLGGLKLVLSTDPNPDVQISWKDKADLWGATSRGKGPVKVTIESDDGINSRGVTRILKHELGHVEGLGHSAASALMKEDAYSSNPGHAPSAANLNSAAAFTGPTADDLAGKKALWGTTEKLSKTAATGNAVFGGSLWNYTYHLQALADVGYTDPVTQFTLDLPQGTTLGDLSDFLLPNDWNFQFFDGTVDGSPKQMDNDEAPSPSLLSFFALSPSAGLLPGQQADLGFSSPLGPAHTRAFTNSPSFDSDEFNVAAPASVPEPSTLALVAAGALLIAARGATRRLSRC